ncbi:hypothetical protein [Nocardioides jiangxiensis]|uniref:SdpI/YhfL protein family protein n=1 Tax=Nocardioides jiangxiensis TaxID=3064524 RepID=A0ABT9B6Y2_9ACTN|nr:hypothetical protein [Nocardioides sp. WY-20]MDO7869071.1 hypothetical protein [Nocardioides sp. WY-20]
MARVVLGAVAAEMTVPGGHCVRSGTATAERHTVRAWLVPGRPRVELPLQHARHDAYGRGMRSAAVMAVAGIAGTIWAATTGRDHPAGFLLLTLAALLLTAVNRLATMVGFGQDADGNVVMTRVHPSAAAAVQRAQERVR